MSETKAEPKIKGKFGTKEWVTNHKVLTVIFAFIALVIITNVVSGDKAPKNASLSTANTSTKSQQTTPASTATAAKPATKTPTPATPAAPAETVSQKNAVGKAKEYVSTQAFSHDGLIDQLVYDQFSTADATYGADNSGADWNAQAAAKAKEYMSTQSFSRQGLIDQLVYDKFTQDQATYGANSVGL